MELQSLVPPEHRKDSVVVCVSPDSVDEFKKAIPLVQKRTGGEFAVTLLSDAKLRIIDLYGLRNDEPSGMDVPNPTTYIIDKSGRVRWRFTEKNYAVRPTNDMVLAELRKLW